LIKCVILFRYSDFHVNEIDKEGNEAILTDFKLPEAPEDVVEPEVDYSAELKEFASEEELKKIQELADNKGDPASNVEIDVTEFDKEKRAKLHKALKVVYGKSIFGNTVERDDKKFIQVKKSSKFEQQRAHGWKWPQEYTYFVMHKENIDTISAIAALSHKTGFKPALFTYAGTKDKRAKTSQWICVKKLEPSKICQAAKNVQGVRVGNFKFGPDTLKLGGLQGNRFKIALRSVKGNKEEIEKSLVSLRDFGFINYYGLQRFGNCVKVPTYMIGKSLLAGNFKQACALIMQERDGEPYYMQKMRKSYAETKDPEKALEMLHSTNTCVEARLLHGLKKHGSTNYLQALLNLPRNMLMLYTHAYQSFIWNQVASKRREIGLDVMEGDLVYTENAEQEIVEIPEEVEATEEETVEETTEEVESKYLTMVRPLTAEDISSKAFTIYDVVLPLPGHDIKYPSNEMGTFYTELMEKDNLTSEKLKSKHK
jgi:tRNA pseudouridine13 synthase